MLVVHEPGRRAERYASTNIFGLLVTYNFANIRDFTPVLVIARVAQGKEYLSTLSGRCPRASIKNVKRVAVVFRFQDGARLINFHFVVFTEGENMNHSRFT
ncbi:hypothetical protein ACLK1S_10515 [Escherichia coli]